MIMLMLTMMIISMMMMMMVPVIFEPGADHGEVEAEAWNSPKMVMMVFVIIVFIVIVSLSWIITDVCQMHKSRRFFDRSAAPPSVKAPKRIFNSKIIF